VERVIGPDATILLDFMLSRFNGLAAKLVVYPDRMLANLDMTHGVIFSQMVLLKLIEKGMSREAAYAVVQKHAMRSWEEGRPFRQLLLKDRDVMACMTQREIDAVFDVNNFLGRIDFIFERVFGDCR
jgi:adenylosuccinate lyase